MKKASAIITLSLSKPVSASISAAISQFDQYPDSALVSLETGGTILDRSRASLYRDEKVGRLTFIKIGKSTRLRVGEIRALMSGSVKNAGVAV
jgi:hypothetical protein